MVQTFISRHNSNFFSNKLVITSVTPASSAPVLQTPKATSSTLYFDSLTVNAGKGGFLHCIQMDTSVNAANQVVSVGADIAFDAAPKFFACLVRFFFSSRRRHTRSLCDWSSDVCSSDLHVQRKLPDGRVRSRRPDQPGGAECSGHQHRRLSHLSSQRGPELSGKDPDGVRPQDRKSVV